jgi:Co/Zn/Cd efflux system component
MKVIVVIGLIAIVVALFSALVFLYRDRGHGTRMVKALALRVGLSILLVTFLIVSYFTGWIGPQGLR